MGVWEMGSKSSVSRVMEYEYEKVPTYEGREGPHAVYIFRLQ